MKFLTDENIGFKLVEFLREHHHNVLSVLVENDLRGINDQVLISLANKERRIIVTLDKDFGALVFKELLRSSGIVLLRLNNESEDNIVKAFSRAFELRLDFTGKFVLVSEDKIKMRTL